VLVLAAALVAAGLLRHIRALLSSIPPAFRPCADRRNSWLRTRRGPSVRPKSRGPASGHYLAFGETHERAAGRSGQGPLGQSFDARDIGGRHVGHKIKDTGGERDCQPALGCDRIWIECQRTLEQLNRLRAILTRRRLQPRGASPQDVIPRPPDERDQFPPRRPDPADCLRCQPRDEGAGLANMRPASDVIRGRSRPRARLNDTGSMLTRA